MAAVGALSQADIDAAMKLGSSELKYLLARENVSENSQALFFRAGIVSVARFGNICQTEIEMAAVIKADVGLDPTASLAIRSEVAGIICAFVAAKARSAEAAKVHGEMEAKKLQKPLMNSEYLLMKAGWEKLHGGLEDWETPARIYLERRIAELEGGELRAEDLKSVLNREQDGEETLQPTWDLSGEVRLKRTTGNIEEPQNPEELRRRLSVMFVGLGFIGLQHTNRAELQGIGPSFVHTYAAYLLGQHVWMLLARDSEGMPVATPAWSLVLKYEHAIRRKAYKLMQETGQPFIDCMKEAWLDPLTKERNFTTPMAIGAVTGKSIEMSKQAPHYTEDKPVKKATKGERKAAAKAKGKAKGRGKGKGEAKGSSNVPKGCAAKTPAGLSVCYGYNDRNTGCKRKDCPFENVCGLCFGPHPMFACKGNRGKPADTAGKGSMD